MVARSKKSTALNARTVRSLRRRLAKSEADNNALHMQILTLQTSLTKLLDSYQVRDKVFVKHLTSLGYPKIMMWIQDSTGQHTIFMRTVTMSADKLEGLVPNWQQFASKHVPDSTPQVNMYATSPANRKAWVHLMNSPRAHANRSGGDFVTLCMQLTTTSNASQK